MMHPSTAASLIDVDFTLAFCTDPSGRMTQNMSTFPDSVGLRCSSFS